MWRRYSADSTDVKTISKLEEQDELASLASLIMNAAAAVAKVERTPLSPAVPEDKKNWTMSDLVEMDAEERAASVRSENNKYQYFTYIL